MEDIFISLLNVSITASYLVLAVLLLRLVFKKAPRWLFCVLWALVGMRLVFPISLESVFSLIPSAETVPSTIIYQQNPQISSGIPVINEVVNPVISESFAPDPAASANPLQILSFIASWVWVIGLVLMLVYTLISYLRLRHRVSTATLFSGNIYQSEAVGSPFVLGVIKPRIYLPYNIGDKDIGHVIAHERAHLKRKDHLIKPLAFLILSIYWFNPLMWVAYVLLCRDIELACDEKVIKELDKDERRQYSTALLNCSVNRRMIAACPLAFGEVGVKERVKSVMNYKKPAFWIIIIAVAVCVITSVCFMTNPKSDTELAGKIFLVSEIKYNFIKNHGTSGIQYCITDDMVLYDSNSDLELRYLGKLEKSDITAEELTNQILNQEKEYPDNPTYTFNEIVEAYATETVDDEGSVMTTYVVIDNRNDIIIATWYDYNGTDGAGYISNVEQMEPVKDADIKTVFSDLQIRITKTDYMGTSQVLENTEVYYMDCGENGGSVELSDGIIFSTEGLNISDGTIDVVANESLVWVISEDIKETETREIYFKLGETATLRTDLTGGNTYYSFDFVNKDDVRYAENLKQTDIHSDYNGVNVYLTDYSSLDGSINYAFENKTEKGIEYGSDYTVYRITDGNTLVKCDTVPNIYWDALLYMQSAQSIEYTYFSTGAYDVTKPGRYRFEKTFNFEGEKEEYKVWFDFELTETQVSYEQEKLEEAINSVLSSRYTTDKESSKVFTAYEIIATENDNTTKGSKNETLTVYLWLEYMEYRCYSWRIDETGGGSTFAAITFYKLDGSEYALKEFWEPRMGSYYMKDVQKKFPEGSNLDETYYGQLLDSECYKQAVAFFAQTNEELPIYSAEAAYAGTSALAVKQFTELCENKDSVKKTDKLHYPVMRIETLEELENFKGDYPLFKLGQSYTADMGYPSTSLNDIPSFYEATQKYNGEFFENYDLYLIYVSEENSLVRHKLACVWYEDGELSFEIISVIPETTDEKELGYFITVAVKKSEEISTAQVDAYSLGSASALIKTYAMVKEGVDAPNFTLNNDGTFSMTFSVAVGYFISGEYWFEGEKLIMVDKNGEKFVFIKESENAYIFDKDSSTLFHGGYNIPDGAVFEYVNEYDTLP